MDGFLQNTKELSEWYYRKYPLCLYNYKKNIVDEEKENVNNGIAEAKKMGIDYIFHTDADELIYVNPDGKETSKDILLRQYLDDVDDNYSCIHFKNYTPYKII